MPLVAILQLLIYCFVLIYWYNHVKLLGVSIVGDEFKLYKVELIEQNQIDRNDSSASVLDSLGLDAEYEELELPFDTKEEITLDDRPAVCSQCRGRGKFKPMFMVIECDKCLGTGYRLDDPVAIIKWQKLCMKWSKNRIDDQKQRLINLTTTKEERLGAEVEKFYAKAKRMD